MPEPYTHMHALTGGSRVDVRGYEQSVAVLLPWQRYPASRADRSGGQPLAKSGRLAMPTSGALLEANIASHHATAMSAAEHKSLNDRH